MSFWILASAASRKNENRRRNAKSVYTFFLYRVPHKIGVSAHVSARLRINVCMRDEEVRHSHSLTHSLTHSGPLQRGACVIRYPRHFSPPFYSSLSLFLFPPQDGKDPSYDPYPGSPPPFVDDTKSSRNTPIRPAASIRRRNPRANTARGATAGFTYVNILLVRPQARLYGNRTSEYIGLWYLANLYMHEREESLSLFVL